jgi:hypothetical protein
MIYLVQGGIKWKPENPEKIETLLCAALGTVKAGTVYGRCGSMLKYDKGVPSLSALYCLAKNIFRFSFDLPFYIKLDYPWNVH